MPAHQAVVESVVEGEVHFEAVVDVKVDQLLPAPAESKFSISIRVVRENEFFSQFSFLIFNFLKQNLIIFKSILSFLSDKNKINKILRAWSCVKYSPAEKQF